MPGSKESIFFTDEKRFDLDSLEEAIAEHLEYSLAKTRLTARDLDTFKALSLAIRDRLIRKWLRTQSEYKKQDSKRVYYLSMEFLMGRLLGSILINMGYYDDCYNILHELGYKLETIREIEPDMGLGNGGLGRLAACLLDSMATLEIPAYGYGIRYEYGMFQQLIKNGYQVELPDHWLRSGNPFEIIRPEHTYRIKFNGRVISEREANGKTVFKWVDTDDVLAVAYDTPVPGYKNNTVNNLRLWSAKATTEFDFQYFNIGDYLAAVETKNQSESISKVLYPNDNINLGRILRLKQEYFFVSASLQNILEYYLSNHNNFDQFPEKVAIQLNDTHPAIAIPELIRLLVDEKGVEWEKAWEITVNSFSYTNHTILPEALEKWNLSLFEKLFPRHLQIIYEINQRFMENIKKKGFIDIGAIRNMSIVEEGAEKKIRMANLSIIGSHSVNGVSQLHTEILKNNIFPDFYHEAPGKFTNITNGITPRRWLLKANPFLSGIISDHIGEKWVRDAEELQKIEEFVENPDFRENWRDAKSINKNNLNKYIQSILNLRLNSDSLYDVQIKRMHEYKRQLLNVLHVITLYNRMRDNPQKHFVPRTVIFSGKAAPGYFMAKLIIKLINSIGEVINNDKEIQDLLKVVFLPNYCVSLAEKIIPAADLSEQISTAGYEASGTGNMKLAMNGALTIGTLDGANLEIMEKVGKENIFIFGLDSEGIRRLRSLQYDPRVYYEKNPELKRVLDMIKNDYFNRNESGLFQPVFDNLVNYGDPYCLLADYDSYIKTQEDVSLAYKNQEDWIKKSILNVARIGYFSSDRTVQEYVRDIWKLNPIKIKAK